MRYKLQLHAPPKKHAMSNIDPEREMSKLLSLYEVARSKSTPMPSAPEKMNTLHTVQLTPPVKFIRNNRPDRRAYQQSYEKCCQAEETKSKITISSLNLEVTSKVSASSLSAVRTFCEIAENYDLMFEYLTLNDSS
jgi:hypothetical protein